MFTIYILKLEQNKYYVGLTKNPNSRIQEHFNGNGSSFTSLYKPIHIVKQIQTYDRYDEDKIVKQCMSKYGILNVRGGSYSNLELSNETVDFLEKEIMHARNACFRCLKRGHFMKNCNAKTNIRGTSLSSRTSFIVKNNQLKENDDSLSTRTSFISIKNEFKENKNNDLTNFIQLKENDDSLSTYDLSIKHELKENKDEYIKKDINELFDLLIDSLVKNKNYIIDSIIYFYQNYKYIKDNNHNLYNRCSDIWSTYFK
jgi:hypothetical protein